jgi:hypothetical protein
VLGPETVDIDGNEENRSDTISVFNGPPPDLHTFKDQQLEINPKKSRLQTQLHRQEVTGLTVNEKVNVPQRYIKQLRMWIYYWEKYGYLRAQQLFLSDYKKDKGHLLKGVPNLANVLAGKLDFLKMVKGESDATYEKLKIRFAKLNDVKPIQSDYNKTLDNVLNTLFSKGLNSAMVEYRKLKKHE